MRPLETNTSFSGGWEVVCSIQNACLFSPQAKGQVPSGHWSPPQESLCQGNSPMKVSVCPWCKLTDGSGEKSSSLSPEIIPPLMSSRSPDSVDGSIWKTTTPPGPSEDCMVLLWLLLRSFPMCKDISTEQQRHQPTHNTFNSKFILSTRNTGTRRWSRDWGDGQWITSSTWDLFYGQATPNTINDTLLHLLTEALCTFRGSTQHLTQKDTDTHSQTVDRDWGFLWKKKKD